MECYAVFCNAQLCCPIATPHILTSNQINSVSGSWGGFDAKEPQVLNLKAL